MTACIVGWSHLPFGRRDHDDVESMICAVASEAINDSGFCLLYTSDAADDP